MYLNLLLGLSGSEKWSTGGITALIGLGMTFVMLALLIGCIFLLRFILSVLEKTNPKLKEKLSNIFKKKNKKEEPVTKETQSEETTSTTDIDPETLSVIEQSVQKYVSVSATDGKPHDKIRILSVKEVEHE